MRRGGCRTFPNDRLQNVRGRAVITGISRESAMEEEGMGLSVSSTHRMNWQIELQPFNDFERLGIGTAV